MSAFIGKIQKFLGTIPPWFVRNANVGAFLEAVALTADSIADSMQTGMALTRPLECDESALQILSRDRGIRVYATEPIASQRYRLAQWRQLRRQFGTHQGEMRNVQPFFLSYSTLPRLRIVHQSGDGLSATWHTLEPDGTYSWSRKSPSNWNWDGVPAKRSRFWLIVYVDQILLAEEGAGQSVWNGGQSWDDGSIWDDLLAFAQITDVVDGIREAKSAHSILWGVIFATDADSFDPTADPVVQGDGSTTLPAGNWGYVIDNNTGQPSRLQSASFVYDLGQG